MLIKSGWEYCGFAYAPAFIDGAVVGTEEYDGSEVVVVRVGCCCFAMASKPALLEFMLAPKSWPLDGAQGLVK